ncbi:hypothetical protein F4811DRAFT_568427 [Daldinia bambusicola]|nr:hypothetical protein F4811DRAFT_568427 [Daldinia bambusicola]
MALSPWQLCFHADLKCRVRACGNKRIVTSNSAAASSPYCRHHVCTVCLKFKTRLKRGHGEEKICHHHGCALAECKEPRCPKKSSPYCDKHACSVKDCDQPRQSPGLCCRKHTCHGRGCINCIHDSSSSSPPSSSSSSAGRDPPYYCHGHQVCQADGGCESLVFHDISHRPARYCFRHFCAASATCEGQRVEGDGAQACRDHSCALHPTCTKPRVDPLRSLFCEDHACADPTCRKQTYDGGSGSAGGAGRWCADHMCLLALLRQADCANRREGTAANPLYCADHGPCAQRRCPRGGAGAGAGVGVGVGVGSGVGCRGGMMCFRASAAAVITGGGRGGGGGGFCACHGVGDNGDDGGDDDDDDDESITDHGDGCRGAGAGNNIGGCVRGGTCDCDDGIQRQ